MSSANKAAIVNLYKDAEFKSEIIANYVESGLTPSLSEIYYADMFSALINPSLDNGGCPAYWGTVGSIRNALKAISANGLSLDISKREAYLSCYEEQPGRYITTFIIGYMGMKKIILRNPHIVSMGTEIIYNSVKFTWLGNHEKPIVISDGRNEGDVVCGICTFKYSDGTYYSVKMDKVEFDTIIQNDINLKMEFGGKPEDSLYNTGFRDRMMRIAMIRYVFREHFNAITGTDFSEMGLGNTNDTPNTSDVKAELESKLASFMNEFSDAKGA